MENGISSERAYAEGYKLVFNVWSPKWAGWTANLKKTGVTADKVYGVAYLISREQLDVLTDRYESVEPTVISIRLENGLEQKNVKSYIWTKKEKSHDPPTDYRDVIIRGLKQHGYTQDIINKVQRGLS